MPDDSPYNSTPDPHESFLRLWTRHEPELRAFVRSCCPRAQEVDGVLQDVSIAAWRKFATLDDHEAFGPWACLIARYELLMARRRFAGIDSSSRRTSLHCSPMKRRMTYRYEAGSWLVGTTSN